MSLQVEKLEKNMAKLTIEVSADELEKALQNAYKKQKNKISMPGFRKGKVPRQMVEKMYGADVFYEDAANALIPQAYSEAYDECDLQIVSQPEIDITQIEKGKPFIFTALVASHNLIRKMASSRQIMGNVQHADVFFLLNSRQHLIITPRLPSVMR